MTGEIVRCAQCRTAYPAFGDSQAAGCATGIYEDHISGDFGSVVADLERWFIDPTKRSMLPVTGLICDDCLTTLDAKEVFIKKESCVTIDDSLEGKIQALEWELNEAIDLMVRVASGEQTVHNMGEWVSLNFPKFRDRLPAAMQAVPPTQQTEEVL